MRSQSQSSSSNKLTGLNSYIPSPSKSNNNNFSSSLQDGTPPRSPVNNHNDDGDDYGGGGGGGSPRVATQQSPASLMAQEALAEMARATGGSFDAGTKPSPSSSSTGGRRSGSGGGGAVRNLNDNEEFISDSLSRKSSQGSNSGRKRMSSDDPSLKEWTLETEEHPLPPFGIQSPVISHLLESWTSDAQKLKYVTLWLSVLCSDASKIPPNFPLGLQLVALKPEIKDGILTLVVPILRNCHSNCLVHSRLER
jgi:hypothetical protein